MPHLRVIAPFELTDQVLEVLDKEPGATHVVVYRNAALSPRGDEITADIARKPPNDFVGALKPLGLCERGAITLDGVDTVLSTAA